MRLVTCVLAALAGLLLAPPPARAVPPRIPAIDQIIEAAPVFSGIVGVRRGGGLAHIASYGRPEAGGRTSPWRTVRWASVTKMVTAVLVMQQVEAGRLDLDAPVSAYLPDWSANPDATIRQLLAHRSGLADPDASPDSDGDGLMDLYQGEGPGWRAVCEGSPRAAPGGDFAYNNCDYLVLGEVLHAVTGQTWAELVQSRIVTPLGLVATAPAAPGARVEGWDGAELEPRVDPSVFGAAGGLYGTVEDLMMIDQALLDGRLMSEQTRATMWTGDPAAGYAALSVWSYPVTLPACGLTTPLVERFGAIGGVQVRNWKLPDKNVAVVAWANDGAVDFGQTWSGQGLAIDLLSAAVCGDGWGSEPAA